MKRYVFYGNALKYDKVNRNADGKEVCQHPCEQFERAENSQRPG
jgi:hypothetical protein